jgi:hypothetical protein
MLWVPYYLLLRIGVYKFYHSFLSPLHSEHTVTKAAQKELTHKTVVYCVRDTERVYTCSSSNCSIHLMRRANTDIAPNKPVTLHRNQLLLRQGLVCTSGFLPSRWKKKATADYFLVVRTDGERNAKFLRYPQIWELNFVQTVCALYWLKHGFCWVGCCVLSATKN